MQHQQPHLPPSPQTRMLWVRKRAALRDAATCNRKLRNHPGSPRWRATKSNALRELADVGDSLRAAAAGLPLCNACSGELGPNHRLTVTATVQGFMRPIGRFSRCTSCGGLHGKGTREAVCRHVRIDQPPTLSRGNAADLQYFDVTVGRLILEKVAQGYLELWDGCRVHGWYDAATGDVVQYG